MINKEDITRTGSTEKSPFKAMRENIERCISADKKAESESGSDTDSDSGADPDINISPKPFAKSEAEKKSDEIKKQKTFLEIMKEINEVYEKFEKRITDDVRIKQQKEAVEEEESRFADQVDGLCGTFGSSDPNGPKLPGE